MEEIAEKKNTANDTGCDQQNDSAKAMISRARKESPGVKGTAKKEKSPKYAPRQRYVLGGTNHSTFWQSGGHLKRGEKNAERGTGTDWKTKCRGTWTKRNLFQPIGSDGARSSRVNRKTKEGGGKTKKSGGGDCFHHLRWEKPEKSHVWAAKQLLGGRGPNAHLFVANR